MKITGYQELENDYNIGYTENGFVVFGTISKQNTSGFTQSEIFQACYKQVRDAIAYENARIAAGKSISTVYVENINDVDFIPDAPQVAKIVISGTNSYNELNAAITSVYTASTTDQYGDAIDSTLSWQSSNGSSITNGSITINPVTTQTEFTITATSSNNVTGTIIITVTAPQTLDDVKQQKKAQLWSMYNQALVDGFVSSASGTSTTYGFSTSNQDDMTQVQAAISAGIETFPIDYGDNLGNTISLTEAQFTTLESDANKFKWAQVKQLRTLIGQAMTATTIDAANAIQWTTATY